MLIPNTNYHVNLIEFVIIKGVICLYKRDPYGLVLVEIAHCDNSKLPCHSSRSKKGFLTHCGVLQLSSEWCPRSNRATQVLCLLLFSLFYADIEELSKRSLKLWGGGAERKGIHLRLLEKRTHFQALAHFVVGSSDVGFIVTHMRICQ